MGVSVQEVGRACEKPLLTLHMHQERQLIMLKAVSECFEC